MSGRIVSSDFLKLMNGKRQSVVKEKENHRSISLRHLEEFLTSNPPPTDEKKISAFMDSRKAFVLANIDYHKECLLGLGDTIPESQDRVENVRKAILDELAPAVYEMEVLNRSKRGISADLQQELEEIIVYCHVMGPRSGEVKATHIVPESYSPESAEYLFGSNEQATRNSPRNALLLCNKIEEAFDRGDFLIVPIATDERTPTRWKCVLVNREKAGDPLMLNDATKTYFRYRDIDHKELQFRNDNRPARRFLYFRFIMGIMKAQKEGKLDIIHGLGLENQLKTFWPLPGEYLCRSTLTILTRAVSGFELPESFLNATTFEDRGNRDLDPHDVSDIRPVVETNWNES